MCPPSSRRTAARIAKGAAALGLVTLGGCIQSPLSTLQPASEVTRSVATLWWAMAAGTGVILLLMIVLAIIAIRRNPAEAPDRRSVRKLLVAGGLILPSSVIAVLLYVGLSLDKAQWPPFVDREAAEAFHVDVIAHRWWWEFRYPGVDPAAPVPPAPQPIIPGHETQPGPDALRTINVLHVPAGVPVHVRIMAADVIHAFWIPRIAGKLDAVPGKINRIRLLVDEPGEYAGVCAEYCGDGHTQMHFTVVAHAPDEMGAAFDALRGGGQ